MDERLMDRIDREMQKPSRRFLVTFLSCKHQQEMYEAEIDFDFWWPESDDLKGALFCQTCKKWKKHHRMQRFTK